MRPEDDDLEHIRRACRDLGAFEGVAARRTR
jgi:hypothetical protein